ncbi:hypothetical protein J4E83_006510 [Alternaria metachromatica]|uniref:uncharacterized protein n=1 Tax=Alternaria metachromatica TaxID=283354 RepID=UPI0020C296AE|nr:uncharacterized protein J4E83_006510 [Alternaria metachromatica]KAI4616928.1 hypothetical protein J4E83_006510 [Alternaria metachromatica]
MKSTIITALLGFASLAVSAPAQLVERQGTLEQVTDSYMFDISIAEFIANRNGKVGPPELNWESNGCTASPDNPFGFDFINSCYRHDFGYRNYKQQGRFDAMKARTDSNFKTDMFNQCATEKAKGPCEATATLYYEAVKAFGKREEEMAE